MPKKIVYVILVSCLLVALTACGGAPDPAEVAPPPAEEEAAVEEEVPADTAVPATEAPTEEEAVAEETEAEETSEEEETPMEMTITSPAFMEGEAIPLKFSCDGDDMSPELIWSGIPEGTASLVFILDDPDAPVGLWVHWVLFNLPADSTGLAEGATGQGVDGLNSWGQTGYGGPCPPGGTHRYFHKLYALDITLDLDAGASKDAIETAMEGHILNQAELIGTYTR